MEVAETGSLFWVVKDSGVDMDALLGQAVVSAYALQARKCIASYETESQAMNDQTI
jgi:hypothetical protein